MINEPDYTEFDEDGPELVFAADPSVSVNPARIIKRGDDPKVIKEEKSGKSVKVKVVDRWAVVHEGKRYVKDDTVTVPESTADEWERSGWVERAVK